ncbi:MAG: PKD domain-containing protein, partial [Caldilineaceae bacterium]
VTDSGYFENRIVNPAHLGQAGDVPTLLANSSAYASVARPGLTRSAYLLSSSEVLVNRLNPTVTLRFVLHDPDGAPGDPKRFVRILVEYAATGSQWRSATPAAGQSDLISATLTREGSEQTFNWNALADAPIGERARVRISVLNPSDGGQTQAAAGIGISPPFQIRATTCVWPADPIVVYRDAAGVDRQILPGAVITSSDLDFAQDFEFRATLREGTGSMRFVWDFGDGGPTRQGQRLSHTYTAGSYDVVLTAVGEACPIARPARFAFRMDLSRPLQYIAMAFRQVPPSSVTAGGAGDVAAASPTPLPPGEVERLAGTADGDRVLLNWSPPASGGAAREIRIYAEPLDGSSERRLEAALPPSVGTYLTGAGCGYLYSVVAANGDGESPSAAYFTPACSEGSLP